MITKSSLFYVIAACTTGGIGIVAPLPDLITGLLFAVAGGFAGMAVSPVKERLSALKTLSLSFLVGLLAAMLHPSFANMGPLFAWMSAAPLQAVMLMAGVCSRPIVKASSTFISSRAKKGDEE